MDELSRKFRSIDWKGLQKSARKMQASTASALKDMVMTDLENKVRAATADTAWGASGSDLMQIAQGTFNREDYALIMSIVWQRLGSSRWRCVYKALEVLRHLIMHGASRCAEEARSALHHLQTLTHYRFVDPKTRRDCGDGVRVRARLVCDMLADPAILEEEREKSKELRAKLEGSMGGPGARMGGLSSEDFRYGPSGRPADYRGEVTATSTTGATNFKGYEEDEGEGAYDDVPGGTFAQRAAGAAEPAHVPDLLGDDEEAAASASAGFGEDDDDDDFDPRAGALGAAQPPPMVGDDDLFGALALTTTGDAAGPPHMASDAPGQAGAAGPLPTSLLIQNLAKQQGQMQQAQMQQVPAQGEGRAGTVGAANGQVAAAESLFGQSGAGDGFGFAASADAGTHTAGAGLPYSGVAPAPAPVRPAKTVVTSKPDADPFGDLIVSAKKSGVL